MDVFVDCSVVNRAVEGSLCVVDEHDNLHTVDVAAATDTPQLIGRQVLGANGFVRFLGLLHISILPVVIDVWKVDAIFAGYQRAPHLGGGSYRSATRLSRASS
jgi:hypothetical protein